jgi:hypothetical protein
MWSPSKINCNRVIYRIPSGGYDEIGTSYIIDTYMLELQKS